MAAAPKLQVVNENDYSNLDEVAEFAEGLKESYLFCRELGHNWRPYSAGRYKDGGFERVLRCVRCKTRRVQEINSRGVVLVNKYIHPEGYLHKGLGRIYGEGRGILRLESIKRVVEKGE